MLNMDFLRIVVLDVANGLFFKDMKIQTENILALMPEGVIYWYLSPIPDEVVNESYNKKVPGGKIIEIIDERVLHIVKFYYKFYDTEDEQFEFIKKRCENYTGQIVVYSCQVEELERLSEYLISFDPMVLTDAVEERVQDRIKEEFREQPAKHNYYGSFHFARKIYCKGPVEIFNLDIPTAELLVARVRRNNYNALDKFICFFKDYEQEQLQALETEKEFKFLEISDELNNQSIIRVHNIDAIAFK